MKRILIRIFAVAFLLFVSLIVVFFILVAWPSPPYPPNQTSRPIAIVNVSVVDTENGRLLPDCTVIVSNGRIIDLSPAATATVPQEAEEIDGSGKFLITGLWDMHAHLGSRMSPQLTMPLFIAAGVTSIREMGHNAADHNAASLEDKKVWREQIKAGKLLGPRIFGQASFIVHGPTRRKEGLPAFYTPGNEEEARQLVEYLAEAGADFIKVYNSVPPDVYFALLKESSKKGTPVAGHKPLAVSAIDASNAGHKSFEHARLFLQDSFPGAGELRKRYGEIYTGQVPGSDKIEVTSTRRDMIERHDPAMFDELVKAMVKNETWFCPTHITRKMDAFADNQDHRNDPRLRYINFLQRRKWNDDADGMIKLDPSPEGRKAFMDFYLKGMELTGKAHRAGVKILAGTDANDTYCFPGLSIQDELKELVTAGLTPAEAIRTATLSPSEYFGLSNDYGSIAVGKMADLVLLNADPLASISNVKEIDSVILNGNLYRRNDLDAMLAYVERNASSLNLLCKLTWAMIQN